jgi:hypothetical protein
MRADAARLHNSVGHWFSHGIHERLCGICSRRHGAQLHRNLLGRGQTWGLSFRRGRAFASARRGGTTAGLAKRYARARGLDPWRDMLRRTRAIVITRSRNDSETFDDWLVMQKAAADQTAARGARELALFECFLLLSDIGGGGNGRTVWPRSPRLHFGVDRWLPVSDRRQGAGFDPTPDRALGAAGDARCFFHRIVAVNFDRAPVGFTDSLVPTAVLLWP